MQEAPTPFAGFTKEHRLLMKLKLKLRAPDYRLLAEDHEAIMHQTSAPLQQILNWEKNTRGYYHGAELEVFLQDDKEEVSVL